MSFERFDPPHISWGEEAAPDPTPSPIATSDPRLVEVRAAIDWLEEARRPSAISEQRWFVLRRDFRAFERFWLDIALGCGWSLLDLFGSPANLSHKRLDQSGAVLFMDGRDLLSIDANRVVINNGPAGPATFYRHSPGVSAPFDRTGGVLFWEAVLNALEMEGFQ